jgi:general secretion pathway protein N
MTVRRLLPWLGIAATLASFGGAAAQTSFAPTHAALDTNTLDTGITPASPDPAPAALAPMAVDPNQSAARPRAATPGGQAEPRGNPLWAIPLSSLTATRERPIFLPSRRPPAPAVAGPPPAPVRPPPPPPAEPDRPRLALVGAVAGDSEGIAIFLDQTTRGIVRLRTGENHSGWILRSVKGREATLQKDRETVLLALPAPSEPEGAPGTVGVPGFQGFPGNPGTPGRKEPEL